jgi:hypothetical protein
MESLPFSFSGPLGEDQKYSKAAVGAVQRSHQQALPAQQSIALVLLFDRLRVVADVGRAAPSAPKLDQ